MEKQCRKCRIMLTPKEENDVVFLECKNCGYKEEYTDWVERQCDCGGNKAIIVYHAMVKGDEGTTTMYRCLRCGETDKDGYKGG